MKDKTKTGYTITKKVMDDVFHLNEVNFEEVNSLEYLQEAVGGYIEVIRLENDVCIWINEEGKINGMKPNTALLDKNGKIFDVIHGDFVLTAVNEEGDTVPMTMEQVNYFETLGNRPIIATMGEKTVVLSTLMFKNFESGKK